MEHTKRFLAMLLASLMLLGLLPAVSISASAETVPATAKLTVQFLQTDARSELEMINEFRTGEDAWYWNSDDTAKVEVSGLSELEWDYTLELVAMQRAVELALSYSHTRPDGTSWYTAYSELGCSNSDAGENIAAGYSSAEAAFAGWREDDYDYSGQGHRRNMLNSSFNRFAAAGVYYNGVYYWAQEFAKRSQTNTPTEACDSSRLETVRVALSRVTSDVLTPSESAVNISPVNGTAALPAITESFKMENYWNDRNSTAPVSAAYTYTIADESVARLEGTGIVGVSEGSTVLTVTSALGGTVEIPINVSETAHEHSYTETVTKEATCGAAGIKTYTCSCGDTYTETVPATGQHTYGDPVISTAPTCTANGWYRYTCTVCGQSYGYYSSRYTELRPLGHEYTPSEPAEDGTVTWTCVRYSACGSSYTSLPGDVSCDGTIDAEDLALLIRHLSGSEKQTGEQALRNADVNCDGSVTAADLILLANTVSLG